MAAHAQAIDAKLAALYKDIPYIANVSGTPALADLLDINKVLGLNKAPKTSRSLVLDPVTEAAYLPCCLRS